MIEKKCWDSRHNLYLLTEILPQAELKLIEIPEGTILLNGSSPIDPYSPTLLLDLDDCASAYHQARVNRDQKIRSLFPENNQEKIKECDSLSRLSCAGEKVYSVLMHILLLSELLENPQLDLEQAAREIIKKDILNKPGDFSGLINSQIAQIFRETTYQPPIYDDIVQLIQYLETARNQGKKTPNLMLFTYGEEEFQALKSFAIAWLKGNFSLAIQGFLFPRQDKGDFMATLLEQKILPQGEYILIDDSQRHVDNCRKNGLEAVLISRPGTKSFEQNSLNPECRFFPADFLTVKKCPMVFQSVGKTFLIRLV
jgi:methionine salvage enolase-phosphatase E1